MSKVPLKTYNITQKSWMSTKFFEVTQDSKVIFLVNVRKSLTKIEINIHIESVEGPIVACARMRSRGTGWRVYVGNPEGTDKADWSVVNTHSLTGKTWNYEFGGDKFSWKRTNVEDKWRTYKKDYDFLDARTGSDPQARFIFDKHWSKEFGKVEFYATLDPNVELSCMASIFGIESELLMADMISSGASAA